MKNLLLIIIMVTTYYQVNAKMSYDEYNIEEIVSSHPAEIYNLAATLFKDNKKDDAVFWLYVGQLRFRFHLMANPNLDKSGDPALFSSLQYAVGEPINRYAGADANNWAKLIEKAKAWDINNPNHFTSKQKYAKQYQKVHSGMSSLIDYIRNNKDELKRQRKQNGLD